MPRLALEVIENRLAEWRRLLRQSTTQGRAVLQRVLRGRVTFTPNEADYDFSAPTRFDKLFAGIVSPRPAFVAVGDTRGSEHRTPADTRDQDYGELLERVCGKGLQSPRERRLSSVRRRSARARPESSVSVGRAMRASQYSIDEHQRIMDLVGLWAGPAGPARLTTVPARRQWASCMCVDSLWP